MLEFSLFSPLERLGFQIEGAMSEEEKKSDKNKKIESQNYILLFNFNSAT